MKKKVIIVAISLVAVITAVSVTAIFIKRNSSQNNLLAVEVSKVKTETVTNKVKTDGTVEYSDTAIVYAETNAKIKAVNVKIGDTVNEGDIIVEYDEDALTDLKNQLSDAKLSLKESQIALEKAQTPADTNDIKQAEYKVNQAKNSITEAEYRLNQLESSINQAKINVENAEKDYNDNLLLFNSGGISKSDLDNFDKTLVEAKNTLDGYNSQYEAEKLSINTAQESLKMAETDYDSIVNKTKLNDTKKEIEAQKVQVERAKLKISQLEKDIADFHTFEKANYTGTIIKVNAKEGEIPSQSTALVEIANKNDIIIKADIDEYDMKDIAVGQKAEIKGDSFNGIINGEITKIYPVAEEKQKYGSTKTMTTVEISIDKNKLDLLKSGYTVKAEITTKTNDNAKVIPLTALLTDKDGNNYVYILNENNQVERKDVTLLSYSNMNIEIDGLNENETVITQTDMVNIGDIVAPMPDDENINNTDIDDENADIKNNSSSINQ